MNFVSPSQLKVDNCYILECGARKDRVRMVRFCYTDDADFTNKELNKMLTLHTGKDKNIYAVEFVCVDKSFEDFFQVSHIKIDVSSYLDLECGIHFDQYDARFKVFELPE